jgi:hypothetical protein
MPCMGPEPNEVIGEYSAELDRLTRVCCDLRSVLRRGGRESDLTNETRKWIREHDKADRERLDQEGREGKRASLKKKALAKLNIDEREALGF